MILGNVDLDFSVVTWDAWQVVIIGQLVVFMSLLTIYLIFRYLIPAIFRFKLRQFARNLGKKVEEMHEEVPADANAAIAMALYLYFNELHDEESNVITINKVSRTYSPWSSKLYNMGNWQR
jgi:glutaconyl-CoA/methylmalonyl-CoA decarboxylase subunit delta